MSSQPTHTAQPQLTRLIRFRQAIYSCFLRAADVLFEIVDALLLSPHLPSFPELSCTPLFRRQWYSLYEGLQDGQIDQPKLLETFLAYLPQTPRPLLVGDHTAWPRCQARTLEDRSFLHQPTPIKGQKPITIGHSYSTLGVVALSALSLDHRKDSWLLPLLHERIKSSETPSEKAAQQLKSVCKQIKQRPLALYDSEYGSGVFVNLTADIDSDLWFRLRPNRKLRRRAASYCGKGRPAIHGPVFRFSDHTTWGEAVEEWEFLDPKLGRVRVERWNDLHFEDAPKREITLFGIERMDARGTRRDPKVVWLGYCGIALPSDSREWREYLSRFIIEHWYRFIKQSLHWTKPRLSTPQQMELWSGLVVVAYWQLWLARGVVEDSPRPWQKAQSELTPGRVHQAMGGVLASIGTPARCPKPRGKSGGWPRGRVRSKRVRYKVVKKQTQKAARSNKQAEEKDDLPP